ncbi:T6SS phospholipase effector Tle1-like catalytic domain-containing protein [Pseudomonas sp. nanlin1]|uniref:T6SS phospholipase effector Tle1-like catalytic domain-containing protein n=1 Tax=Pseudomonas sp. nanlin1 TaxID=3040605 RepID=UPI003890F242
MDNPYTLRIGVFFDGTGNNRHNADLRATAPSCQQDSYANAKSNIAKLFELYPRSATDAHGTVASIYVEGVGTLGGHPDTLLDKVTGTGNTGMQAKVQHAVERAAAHIEALGTGVRVSHLRFDLFGFSRGAAEARHFANELALGPGSPLAMLSRHSDHLAEGFDWSFGRCVSIAFIGLFDTVATRMDLYAATPGAESQLKLRLAPGIADHIAHFVARDEHRHHFPLSPTTDADLLVPGAHADIGGGYRPCWHEELHLSRPCRSTVDRHVANESSPSYQLAQQQQRELAPALERYGFALAIKTWANPFHLTARGDHQSGKHVHAALVGRREVQHQLAHVYGQAMHELASSKGVPFNPLRAQDPALVLPDELLGAAGKIRQYLLGRQADLLLSDSEERLLKRRYIHYSSHWNSLKAAPVSDLDALYPNRPATDRRRLLTLAD